MPLFETTVLAASVLVGLSLSASAGPFEDGSSAYRRGDFATAMEIWRPLADHGNVGAQFAVGNLYKGGLGVPQGYAQAFAWYRKAADRGFREAEAQVGIMYEQGLGVSPDDARGGGMVPQGRRAG